MLAPPPVPVLAATSAARADTARFSTELRELIARFRDTPASLADLFAATQGRGYHFVLILIAVPFVTPIPLPGVSIPFGLAVAALGARLVLDRGPWLPRWLLQRKLPPRFFGGVLGAASKLLGMLEVIVRPRLGFISGHAVFARLAGLMVASAGVMLMLPVPLPLSNSLPAWTVLFLSFAALGHDGLFFLLGCVAFMLSIAFFTLVAVGGVEAMDLLGGLLTFGQA